MRDRIARVGLAALQRTIDSGATWQTLSGAMVEVSEGSDGGLWGLDSNGHVWRRD